MQRDCLGGIALAKEKQLDYETAFRRLEEIAAVLEQGAKPLEENLTLFEEGAKLAAFLQQSLAAAEQKLATLRLEGGAADD
jgi:exodeoxyribonuclease VII small subunit